MSKNQALSLRTQWLGERLRAARSRAGYTLAEAGVYLNLEAASISRFERGTHSIRPSYVRDLIAFYGVSDERERNTLLRLNEDAWRKDWWDGDTSDLDAGFIDYTWLEARATHIYAFSPLIVHGLCQTARYSRAVTLNGFGFSDANDEVERMVELRLQRQEILKTDPPTRLSVVLEEPAVKRPVGGREILRDQLNALLTLGIRESIDIRVLTSSATWDPGYAGSFTVFNMPDPYPDVAYVENMAGRSFLEHETKVETFRRAFNEIQVAALDVHQSANYISARIEDSS